MVFKEGKLTRSVLPSGMQKALTWIMRLYLKTAQRVKATTKREGEEKQNKTKQNETKRSETKRNETKRNETKRNETKRNKTKQNKTKQNKTKQNKTNKTKQNKTKHMFGSLVPIRLLPALSIWREISRRPSRKPFPRPLYSHFARAGESRRTPRTRLHVWLCEIQHVL